MIIWPALVIAVAIGTALALVVPNWSRASRIALVGAIVLISSADGAFIYWHAHPDWLVRKSPILLPPASKPLPKADPYRIYAGAYTWVLPKELFFILPIGEIPVKNPRQVTLKELFELDFAGPYNGESDLRVLDKSGNLVAVVMFKVVFALETGSKFVCLYVPSSGLMTKDIVKSFAAVNEKILTAYNEYAIRQPLPGDSRIYTSANARFTGTVYFYV